MLFCRNEFPPRDHAVDAEIYPHVQDSHHHEADHHGTRDGAARIFHFVAQVADVVVPEEIIQPHACRRTEAEEESRTKGPGILREIEGLLGIEVKGAPHEDDGHREQNTNPEDHHHPPETGDRPPEQGHVQDAEGDHHRAALHRQRARRGHSRPQVVEVLGHADVAGGDLHGTADDELPDEQERHETPPGPGTKALAEPSIGAAGSGQGGAEFTPDQGIGQGDRERHEPSEQRLRPAQRGHEKRNGDERPHADHVRHVQRRGWQHGEPALQMRFRPGIRCWSLGGGSHATRRLEVICQNRLQRLFRRRRP